MELREISSRESPSKSLSAGPEITVSLTIVTDEAVEVGYDDGFVFLDLVTPEALHPVCSRLSRAGVPRTYKTTLTFPREWLPDWPRYSCAIRLVKHRKVPLFSRSTLSNTITIPEWRVVESFR